MKKNNDIEIFIAAHKLADFPKNGIYIPLHVGAKGKDDLGLQKDSDGKNISEKNANYCELTGLYWIWKNCKSDIVGLVHYRRYFYNKFLFNKKNDILTKDNIKKILKKNDIIVAQRGYTWKSTVKNQYEKYHIKDDLDKCEKILKKMYPDYSNSFDIVFNGNSYCPYNMIITKKYIFDDYCKWLFSIFFELEKQVDMENRDKYNARVYGFLSERLLNVWLIKNNNYTVIEKPVYNKENTFFIQELQAFIKKGMTK